MSERHDRRGRLRRWLRMAALRGGVEALVACLLVLACAAVAAPVFVAGDAALAGASVDMATVSAGDAGGDAAGAGGEAAGEEAAGDLPSPADAEGRDDPSPEPGALATVLKGTTQPAASAAGTAAGGPLRTLGLAASGRRLAAASETPLRSDGTAYAVLIATNNGDQKAGDLIFFRSDNDNLGDNYSDVTGVTDLYGTSYSGTLYTGVENTDWWGSPWSGQSKIKRAYVADGQAIQPLRCCNWFRDCEKLTSFDVSGLDTSKVTDMGNMFLKCSSLASLDLSSLNTSSVTEMDGMFSSCYNLTSISLSGWDTSKVTDMENMFSSCYNLTSIDLSGWDTHSVTNMRYMFSYCTSLTSLNLSGWNTSSVTNMCQMFQECEILASLDLSGWDTSSVTNTQAMFQWCDNLTSLNLSGWNTSSVKNMDAMFQGCYVLTSLDLSGWDTSKVTSMFYMFSCSALTSLDLSGWDTSKVTDMRGMFSSCSALTSLDLSGWDNSSVTRMEYMFNDCSKLARIVTDGTFSFWGASTGSTPQSVDLPEPSSAAPYTGRWVREGGSSGTTYSSGELVALQTNGDRKLPAGTYVWAKASYAYTLDAGEHGRLPEGTLTSGTYVPGSETALPGPTVTSSGATFLGWEDQHGNTYTAIPADMAGDLTLTASYKVVRTDGTAYAVLTSSADARGAGHLVLFRSEESYSAGAGKTVTDLNGDAYVGQVFTGIETSDGDVPPWYGKRADIKRVYVADGQAIKPRTCEYWFGYCENLASCDLHGLDTSAVTSMRKMFTSCPASTVSGVVGLDTSHVQDMSWMFNYVYGDTLDLTWMDTSSATDMSYMFAASYSLRSLDISSWDTRKVETFNWFFDTCWRLEEIKVGENWSYASVDEAFPTGEASDSKYPALFMPMRAAGGTGRYGYATTIPPGAGAYVAWRVWWALDAGGALTLAPTAALMEGLAGEGGSSGYLYANGYSGGGGNASSWRNANYGSITSVRVLADPEVGAVDPTSTASWFSGCGQLESADLSGLDTSRVTSMGSMFYNCSNLASLDLSGFDTSSATDMSYMFSSCSKLARIVTDGTFSFWGASTGSTPQSVDLPEPSSAAPYTGRWVREGDRSGTTYSSGELVALQTDGDRKLPAGTYVWQQVAAEPEPCGLTLVPGEGKIDPTDPAAAGLTAPVAPATAWTGAYTPGTETALPTPVSRDPYKAFVGWLPDGGTTTTYRAIPETATGALSLTAVYRDTTAYAVLTDASDAHGAGHLILFRSLNAYADGAGQTAIDAAGTTYHGRVYTGVEDVTGTTQPRWYNERASITAFAVAPGQVIRLKGAHALLSGTGVTTVDLSGLDTSAVGDFGELLAYCTKLTSADVSALDTRAATDLSAAFAGCTALTTLTTGAGWAQPSDAARRATLPVAMRCATSGHDDGPYATGEALRSGAHALAASGLYTIHFDGNGATSGEMSDQAMSCGTPARLKKNAFERDGYRFDGWQLLPDGMFEDEEEVIDLAETGTVTLVARWSKARLITLAASAQDFASSEKVEEFTAPHAGSYLLEAWGAQGGEPARDSQKSPGGKGGYSRATATLGAGTVLYVCAGGRGGVPARGSSTTAGTLSGTPGAGGYNGGGAGGLGYCSGKYNYVPGAGGGGATSVSAAPGTLAQIGEAGKGAVLLVAGGGGGGAGASIDGYAVEGGAGGGLSGLASTGWRTSAGGGQSEGFAFGQGQVGRDPSSDAHDGGEGGGGGGGGWWGGRANDAQGRSSNAAGGGGSGYVKTSGAATATTASGATVTIPALVGETVAGNLSFPSPTGPNETGHAGDGHARVSYLGSPVRSYTYDTSVTLDGLADLASVNTAFAREGYEFRGWSKTPGSGTVDYADGATITDGFDGVLYAVWKALPAAFSLNPNGGTIADGDLESFGLTAADDGTYSGTYTPGAGEALPEPTPPAGRAFLGWRRAASDGEPFSSIPDDATGDLTLVASYGPRVLSTEGTAYAVFATEDGAAGDDGQPAYLEGDLIFFRSTNASLGTNGSTVTDVEDVCGNHWSGILYTGVEDTPGGFYDIPWEKKLYYTKRVYVAAGQTIRPLTMQYWFGYAPIESFDATGFDTSQVTSMQDAFMYSGSRSGTCSLDLSSWDTSNVTNLREAFLDADYASIDVSGWNTSNVENMNMLFYDCEYLKHIDLSSWDTRHATNMSYMFHPFNDDVCAIESIKVGPYWSYDSAKDGVPRFPVGMRCTSGANAGEYYPSLDYYSNYNPYIPPESSCTYEAWRMWWALDSDGLLTLAPTQEQAEADLPGGARRTLAHTGWQWCDATDVQGQTYWSSWGGNIRSVVVLGGLSMYSMEEAPGRSHLWNLFLGLSNLVSADLSGLDMTYVSYMKGLFNGCPKLESVNLTNIDTSEVTNMGDMFAGCGSLKQITVDGTFGFYGKDDESVHATLPSSLTSARWVRSGDTSGASLTSDELTDAAHNPLRPAGTYVRLADSYAYTLVPGKGRLEGEQLAGLTDKGNGSWTGTYPYGDEDHALPAPKPPAGKRFVGWSPDGGTITYRAIPAHTAGDLTLTAVYEDRGAAANSALTVSATRVGSYANLTQPVEVTLEFSVPEAAAGSTLELGAVRADAGSCAASVAVAVGAGGSFGPAQDVAAAGHEATAVEVELPDGARSFSLLLTLPVGGAVVLSDLPVGSTYSASVPLQLDYATRATYTLDTGSDEPVTEDAQVASSDGTGTVAICAASGQDAPAMAIGAGEGNELAVELACELSVPMTGAGDRALSLYAALVVASGIGLATLRVRALRRRLAREP